MPDNIPWAALAPVLVLLMAFLVYCWVDIAYHPVRYLPKWTWALICCVMIPLGPIVYLVFGRDHGQE